jgi:hypothetical protein
MKMATASQKLVARKALDYKKWVAGIAIILTVFFFVPTYLVGPDGLERVMEDQRVETPAPIWNGLLTDYMIPGIDDPFISGLLAGFVGIGITLGLMSIFVIAYKRLKKDKPKPVTRNLKLE